MSAGAIVGVMLSLGLVLGLLAIALRVLRHYAAGPMASRGRFPMEVVQRLPLGPRQGVAVVRIGERVVALSVGEGGVRPLLELGAEEMRALTSPQPAPQRITGAAAPDFIAAFRTAVKAALPSLLLGASLLAGPSLLEAQSARPLTPRAPTAAAQAERIQVQEEALRNQGAKVDSMLAQIAPTMDLRVGQQGTDGLRLSGTVGIVVLMGLLTLLPTLVLMMTSFTRILIVLHFLRQALGTQSSPPSHLVAGLALLLSGFVMAPTLSEAHQTAIAPWMEGRMEQAEMLGTAAKPFREFMLRQTRERDLQLFIEMSRMEQPGSIDEVPLVVVMSAFVTSELRTAFQIGFALFLPFIIIDIVVASVLMSMGMFMLPPAMIALPFKLLLFVLVDGWTLIVQSLVASFK